MWKSTLSEKRQCSAKNRHNAQHNKLKTIRCATKRIKARPAALTTRLCLMQHAVCGFSSLCVIWCSSIVVVVSRVAWIPHVSSRYMQRIRGPTVSLGVVEPREFDVLAPAAQHNVLLCVLWKYDSWYFEKVLRINY